MPKKNTYANSKADLFTWVCVLFLLFSAAPIHAEEETGPVCKKCEMIREYNKQHPNNYEYYEDYLKEINDSSDKGKVEKAEEKSDSEK